VTRLATIDLLPLSFFGRIACSPSQYECPGWFEAFEADWGIIQQLDLSNDEEELAAGASGKQPT
jgi:hypothetical protein